MSTETENRAGRAASSRFSGCAEKKVPTAETSHARTWSVGFVIKLVLMALVNALGIYIIAAAFNEGSWILVAVFTVLLVIVDYVYFSRKHLAPKYLTPGLVFLAIFQVFVILYTGYIAFTNYGDRHMLTKERATEALLLTSTQRVEGSAQYPLAVVDAGGELGFAIVNDDGAVLVGTEDAPFVPAKNAQVSGKRITEVPGYEILTPAQIGARQAEITALRVPMSEDPGDGFIGTQTATTGFVFQSTLKHDAAADTLTDITTGKVYHADSSDGFYRADDGETLSTGWRVTVGFKNFADAFGDARYASPFLKVLVWTFAFAFLSVATTFLLGMFFALVMNDERMRGRKIYRTIMLLPYAFPSFMTAFLFAGMLNPKYGFFNQVLFGGAEIGWLTDPWLAKLSVILVNLWMGFPYMFLICTGALQSIPSELNEAAEIDGAGGLKRWRYITLPQLMIQVTPLLISSFAFNFNNFNLIYMLTRGGPQFADASVPVGSTDILISMVYQISGLSGAATKNYGLASAMSILIFVIVGTISLISFRRSRSIEGAQ
ncbi:ABC transporter permease subunit [Actinotignum sp. GS-2025f]|uniref:ABC transporter permease subunit n=1 Tax=Actinotignum sp. GS-2025f TaxID=3427279 RepID=UPI003F46EB54